MTIFTVHVRQSAADLDAIADDMVLVPEKFSMAAVLLGPLWLLFHRLWISFVLWIAVAFIVFGALYFGNATQFMSTAYIIGALLLGLEANALKRRELQFLGYDVADVTSGNSVEEGERRYLDRASQVGTEKFFEYGTRPPEPSRPDNEVSIGGLFDVRR